MREADMRSRRRRVLCVAGFALSTAIAALFIVTLCRTVGYFAEGWTLIGFHGAVVFSFYKGGQGWSYFPFPQPLQFGDIFWRPGHDPKVTIVPLWMPFPVIPEQRRLCQGTRVAWAGFPLIVTRPSIT